MNRVPRGVLSGGLRRGCRQALARDAAFCPEFWKFDQIPKFGLADHPNRDFYYICIGRQDRSCDLPYMPVEAVENAVVAHYVNVRLADDFRTAVRHSLDETMSSTTGTTRRSQAQYARQLKELAAREDGLLDLVGDPDWPKDKLTAKDPGHP